MSSDDSRSTRVETIERYVNLLKTRLSDVERAFIQRRIAQERHAMAAETFVTRANIDHYIGLLNGDALSPETRATVTKLLVAEVDRLNHDLEQLQFVESRAAKGRERLGHLRKMRDAAAPQDRELFERLVTNVEDLQRLLDGFCQQMRDRLNSRDI